MTDEVRRVRLDGGFSMSDRELPAAVREHLDRQRGVADGFVKLDTGRTVRVGEEDRDDV